jgi:hypothetical protein
MDWQRGVIPFYNLPPDYDERKENPKLNPPTEQTLEETIIETNNALLKQMNIIT